MNVKFGPSIQKKNMNYDLQVPGTCTRDETGYWENWIMKNSVIYILRLGSLFKMFGLITLERWKVKEIWNKYWST